LVSRQEYDEAKRELAAISHRLETERLTPKERKDLELRAYQLSGWLFRPWLPVYWSRRLIMLGIFLLGLQQMWVGNRYGFLLWLLMLPFSPRVMG
jgi:fatty acid desaturase